MNTNSIININNNNIQDSIPKIIFIVPYRDRELHKKLFEKAMKHNLIDLESYKIYYIHQHDNRVFNRGAMKNIGFLIIKNLYPSNYKDITFVFHDIDVWGINKDIIKYDTNKNRVKHFYGFTYALGGIVSIKGCDFELSKGYPNYWGWGFEDNMFNDRCLDVGLEIDRNNFYNIQDKNIHHELDEIKKPYNKRNLSIYKFENSDTLFDIQDIEYNIQHNDIFNMVNITNFKSYYHDTDYIHGIHDIRNGTKILINKNHMRRNWNMKTMFT
tara:strand:- start:1290 stop:2099 length:810 start_codon:yes stop_codon:yes gene_type:complete